MNLGMGSTRFLMPTATDDHFIFYNHSANDRIGAGAAEAASCQGDGLAHEVGVAVHTEPGPAWPRPRRER